MMPQGCVVTYKRAPIKAVKMYSKEQAEYLTIWLDRSGEILIQGTNLIKGISLQDLKDLVKALQDLLDQQLSS